MISGQVAPLASRNSLMSFFSLSVSLTSFGELLLLDAGGFEDGFVVEPGSPNIAARIAAITSTDAINLNIIVSFKD
jgi:hypothetical protein